MLEPRISRLHVQYPSCPINYLHQNAEKGLTIKVFFQEAHVNQCYKHFYYFVTELNLVDRKELEPLVSGLWLFVTQPTSTLGEWGWLSLNLLSDLHLISPYYFSNSLIIHAEKTKEITTMKEVWICDLNYHKIWWTFALIFSKNY